MMLKENPLKLTATFFIFSLVGFIFTIQEYIYSQSNNHGYNWGLHFISNEMNMLFWVPTVPILFLLYQRYPLQKPFLWRSVFTLIPLSVLIAGFRMSGYFFSSKSLEKWVGVLTPEQYERTLKHTSVILLGGALQDLIIMSLIFAAFIFLGYYKQFQEEQKRNTEILQELTRAQLETLKMQIQPHFLFNTLHTISSLMEESIEKAQHVMSKLASFLRFSLDYQNETFITLEQEIHFINTYLSIEAERFSDRLNIVFEIDPKTLPLRVPSFIVQPLIENCFKHGVNKFSSVTQIFIRSSLIENHLIVVIGNNGHFHKGPVNMGIGLTNVQKRLTTLYGLRFTFKFEAEDEYFINTIRLPIEELR